MGFPPWSPPINGNGMQDTLPGNPDLHWSNVVLSPTKCFDTIKAPLNADSSTRLFVNRATLYNGAAAARVGIGPILALAKWGGGQIDAAGVYTDDTVDLQDVGANDFPVSTLVNNTGYIIGATERWTVAQIVVGTAEVSVGATTYEYTYWNGAWTSLTGFIIDTPSYASTGTKYLTFFAPGDWIIGGTPIATVPTTRYNIRVRATAAPDDTAAILTKAQICRLEAFRKVAATAAVDITLGAEPAICGLGESLTAYWETADAASFVDASGEEHN